MNMKKKTLIVAFALFTCVMAAGCADDVKELTTRDTSIGYDEPDGKKTVGDDGRREMEVTNTPTPKATNTPLPTNTPIPVAPASDFEYSVNDNGVSIDRYLGSDTVIVIPAEIDGIKVTGIGRYALCA